MKAAIVDLDGTLCDCRHRLHHVTGAARDWPAFFGSMADDTCVEPIRDVVRSLARDHSIVLCSGRPEDYRPVTVKWLDDHAVPYDALYMRASGDTRPDHIVKMQILDGIREDGHDPFVVIDDRPSVVAAWREAGLVCMQVAPPQNPIPANAKLTVMVGPSGAGKTSWLAMLGTQYGIVPQHVISSDQIRQDLCGDHRDQTRNFDVFEAVRGVAHARLKHGLPTVIDATHIRRKDRVAAALLVPPENPVTYIVINRPMTAKMTTAGWREVYAPGLIERHEQTFAANLKDILAGDGLANVRVVDLRGAYEMRRAA